MRKLIPLLILLCLLVAGCEVFDPQQNAELELRDLIYEITQAYNWGDIDTIMQQVNMDFRHKGMSSMQLRQLWLDRMARYPLMEAIVTSVDGSGAFATVSLDMRFTSATESVLYTEPQDNGDLSYFIHAGGKWQIYGDQMYIKLER